MHVNYGDVAMSSLIANSLVQNHVPNLREVTYDDAAVKLKCKTMSPTCIASIMKKLLTNETVRMLA